MKSGTRLEQQQQNKKELGELQDEFNEIEGIHGREYVVNKEKAKLKARKAHEQNIASDLETKKKSKVAYRERLVSFGNTLFTDFEENWEVQFIPTGNSTVRIYGKQFQGKEGVVLILKSPTGKVFIRAVSTSYDPPTDIAAVKTLSVQAENTVDSVKGLLANELPVRNGGKKTPGGIYLP